MPEQMVYCQKFVRTYYTEYCKGDQIMSRMCAFCGKKPMVGCHVSHAHNVNKRRFNPNLQRVRAVRNGRVQKIMACTSCIKKGLVIKTA